MVGCVFCLAKGLKMYIPPSYTNEGAIVTLTLGQVTAFVSFTRNEEGGYEYQPKENRGSPLGPAGSFFPNEPELVRLASGVLFAEGHAVITPGWDQMLPN